MPENRLLAIVILAYKAKFLDAALDSILAQTIPSSRVSVGSYGISLILAITLGLKMNFSKDIIVCFMAILETECNLFL